MTVDRVKIFIAQGLISMLNNAMEERKAGAQVSENSNDCRSGPGIRDSSRREDLVFSNDRQDSFRAGRF